MKTTIAPSIPSELSPEAEVVTSAVSLRRFEEDERSEEAFEARILRVDDTTAERLFRKAGE